MTLSPAVKVATVAGLIIMGLVALLAWREYTHRLEATRLADELLTAKGVIHDEVVKHEALEREKTNAMSESALLKRKVTDLTTKLGKKPQIVTVEHWVTLSGPSDSHATPIPQPAQPKDCPTCPPCLYAPGNTGKIKLVDLKFEAKEYANIGMAVGVAQFWRLTPPESMLFEQEVSEETTLHTDRPPLPLTKDNWFFRGTLGKDFTRNRVDVQGSVDRRVLGSWWLGVVGSTSTYLGASVAYSRN